MGRAVRLRAIFPGAQTVPLVEQAVEITGVFIADIGNDLLDAPVTAAQQPGSGLHAVLLQQLL